MATMSEQNKSIVKAFYDLAFNDQRPAEAAAKYIGPTYRQHNPGAADGPEPFVAFVTGFLKAFPKLRVTFKRMLAEGEHVALHSHFVREPGDRGLAVMDIFRLENGKLVEHWDVLQEVPSAAANPNTMF
jgi:predicted SnoaL-like aldol condensation-catalyzing enzyme